MSAPSAEIEQSCEMQTGDGCLDSFCTPNADCGNDGKVTDLLNLCGQVTGPMDIRMRRAGTCQPLGDSSFEAILGRKDHVLVLALYEADCGPESLDVLHGVDDDGGDDVESGSDDGDDHDPWATGFGFACV